MMFEERGFNYFECLACSLIFLKNRVKKDDVGIIYDNFGYHQAPHKEFAIRNAQGRLKLLGALPQGASVHDDGAGMGSFVYVAKKNNYVASGSDLGGDARQKAKEIFGVDLKAGTLSQLNLPSECLDALTSFNILSHVYEPWDYLKEMNRVLKPQGLLLIRAGDHSGFFKNFGWGSWGAPEHVFHFNRHLLNRLLKEHGFKVLKVMPAFDSEYPYLFYKQIPKLKGWKEKLCRKACGISNRLWTIAGLPKEDIYILSSKQQSL